MNKFYHGDCLFVMEHDIAPESVDLIYLDPPFFTGKVQKGGKSKWNPGAMEISFEDSKRFWGNADNVRVMREKAPPWLIHIAESHPDFASYLYYMMERLQACHKVLKPTGSIYLHCDWRASHYLKMIMDESKVFGFKNFQNEIVWHYRGRGMQAKRFQRKHDTILFYSKSNNYIFRTDEVKVPLDPKHISRYNKLDEDGKKYALIKKRGEGHTKVYLKEDGIVMDDVWDIPFIHGDEAVGYPTQKPRALLERIILASSNEGDVVLDPFGGCGTSIIVAHRLNRRWIGIDISKDAYDVTSQDRTRQMPLGMTEWFAEAQHISRDLQEVKALNSTNFEAWVNEFYGATKPSPDRGIDGIMLDGTPIQTKTYLIKYDKVGQFHSDTKHHPCVSQPVKRMVMVSQVGFDDSARQRKAEIESKENVRVELITLEDMLPNQGGATKDR